MLLRRKTKILPLVAAAAASTSVILNIILVPLIGSKGAAISNLASYFILAAVVTVWAGRTIKFKPDIWYLSKVIGVTLIMAAALYFLNAQDA